MSHKYLNLAQDGEEDGDVISTDVRIIPKNFLAFSFDPFATLV